MARLLAPIMSFTCDEVWKHLPKMESRPESVHLSRFPLASDILGTADSSSPDSADMQQAAEWTTLRGVREQVMKSLEEARAQKQIGKGLEAQVKLIAADPLYSVLDKYKDDLRYLFIVSWVTLERGTPGNGTGDLKIEIANADGQKCERCWNFSTRVGEDSGYPTLCERCTPVVKQLEANAALPPSKS
jgi:isoleucyl-tRNA synthetase